MAFPRRCLYVGTTNFMKVHTMRQSEALRKKLIYFLLSACYLGFTENASIDYTHIRMIDFASYT